MAKLVSLTWKSGGRIIEEDCYLVDDADEIFIAGSDLPISVITKDGVGNTVGAIAGGRVMFEDEDGLFGLLPEEIVSIELKE